MRAARLRGPLMAATLAVALAACTTDASSAGAPAPSDTAAATTAASSTPTAHPTGARGTALALLGTLAVKGRAPKTGYSRAQFGPSWTDDNAAPDSHNGCRTRDDILARDLAQARTSNGCTVDSGELVDPYTGARITFRYGPVTSAAVQIDHVVALGDAWQTGAQQWSAQKRTAFANDPLNLLAVDGSTNEGKGDSDAASWLPPNKSYRCAYVARQVAVKARYGLWVTAAERDAIARVLSRCPGEPAPTEGGAPPRVAPRATPTTSSSPARSKGSSGVLVYPNCAALTVDYPHGVGRPGARDHTSGTPDTRFTVNRAVYDANTARDGDGDGIACER
jgi:hypothetical protein